jgi:hypothetical protein
MTLEAKPLALGSAIERFPVRFADDGPVERPVPKSWPARPFLAPRCGEFRQKEENHIIQ